MNPKMTPDEKAVFGYLVKRRNKWYSAWQIGNNLHLDSECWISERQIRQTIQSLRLVHGKTIASSWKGYCYTGKKEELKKTASFIRRHALLELKTANAIDKQANHDELAKQLEFALLKDSPPDKASEMAEQLVRLNIPKTSAIDLLMVVYKMRTNAAYDLFNKYANKP